MQEYLEEAYRAGFEEVRIIHGRGIGVQREIVRAVLSRTPWVISFRDARPEGEAGGPPWPCWPGPETGRRPPRRARSHAAARFFRCFPP